MPGTQERPGPYDPGQSLFKFTAVNELFHCGYCVTVRVTVVVCVMPPPVPVMVIVWFPSPTFWPTVTFIVELPEPGAGMGLGLNFVPLRFADKVITALNSFAISAVIVDVPELPLATVIAVGFALRLKLAAPPDPRSALIRPFVFGVPHPLAKS